MTVECVKWSSAFLAVLGRKVAPGGKNQASFLLLVIEKSSSLGNSAMGKVKSK